MAESVLTNTNANFQAFQQATTYAQQRAQAAENARASITALIPDAQAAANAKADALIAAGAKADALIAAGAKTNAVAAAALLPDLRAARLAATATAGLIPHSGGDHTTIPAGAGVYRIMTDAEAGQVWERVAGGGVLRRPELEAAAATDVQETRALAQQADSKADSASDAAASAAQKTTALAQTLAIPDVTTLAGLNVGDAQTLVIQHPERGGTFVRSADQASPAIPTKRVRVGGPTGVWFVRRSPPKEWRADHIDVQGDYGGNWGAALSALNARMADNDRFIIPPREGGYYASSPAVISVPVVLAESEGAWLDVDHNGVAWGFDPGGGRIYVGDRPGDSPTFRGTVPGVVRRDARIAPDASVGVRLGNAYWPELRLQAIKGFGVGFQPYARDGHLANRPVGLTYGHIRLGRLENQINIKYDLQPTITPDAPNYITQMTYSGGSFQTNGFAGPGRTHIQIDGGPTPGMVDNTMFTDTPAFEGAPEYILDLSGQVEGLRVLAGRLETGDNLIYALRAGPTVRNCELFLDGFASVYPDGTLRMSRIQDAGAWNVVEDNKFPFGRVRYYNGVYYLNNPGSVQAPVEWQPTDFDRLPVQEIYYTTNTQQVIPLDMRRYRRFEVTAIQASGNPEAPPGDPAYQNPQDVYNNLFTFVGEPAGRYEFEVCLVQSARIGAIYPAWLNEGLRWGDWPQPTVRLYGRDYYRIRVQGGLRYVVGHWRS